MITTDTTNKLGTTVAEDLRTVMQGKVAIAGEASYEGARRVFNGAVDRRPTLFASVRTREMYRRRCVLLERMVFRCPCAVGGMIGQEGR